MLGQRVILSLFLSILSVQASGEALPPSLSKEELQMKLRLEEGLLRLREAERAVHKNEAAYQEALDLQGKGIYTNQEVNLAEERYNQALKDREQSRIDLEKTKLEFFQNASHIAVESAIKYPRPDGTKGIRLTVRNTSDLDRIRLADRIAGEGEGARSAEQLEALLKIENLFVSLVLDGTVIARPYEVVVPTLANQEARTLDFLLVAETDRVAVQLKFLDRVETVKVYLETQASDDRVTVESVRFSQEGKLGEEVSYDIRFERLIESEKTFRLAVIGLPRDFRGRFLDQGGAAVNRVRFGRGTTQENLKLEVSVPRELESAGLDKEIRFYAVAGDEAAFKDAPKDEATAESLREAGLGAAVLTLIPRGVGEMTLSAANYLQAMRPGEKAVFTAELKNTGTLPLFGTELDLRGPRSWKLTAEPQREIDLERGQEVRVRIEVDPLGAPDVGDYEVRATARCRVAGELIESEERVFRIRAEGEAEFGPTFSVALVLLTLVSLAAWVAVRMSRR